MKGLSPALTTILLGICYITVVGVSCDCGSVNVVRHIEMNPIHCEGTRNEELEITPELPDGLIFVNNTIHGNPKEGMEFRVYTITSKFGESDPFYLQLGVFWYPLKVWIDQSHAIVTKGVFTKILVHSDVAFDSMEIFPILPPGLVFDPVTRTIMGIYNGTDTGRNCYTVIVHNSLGSCTDTICLFYTTSAINGLRYQIRDAENFTKIFKAGITTVENLSSKGMMSPLYIDMNSVNTDVVITLQSHLYMKEKGFYGFRLRSNNPQREEDSFFMTVDGVTVYDSSHGPLSSIRENSHSLNVVVPGYRELMIRFRPTNPYYRTMYIEWMRPSRSHFERIESEQLITIHRFHVEYLSSVVVMNAGEALTLSPILNSDLLQGARLSYRLLVDPPCNITIDSDTGDLQVTPVIEGFVSNLPVRLTVEFHSYVITTDLHFQFIILPDRRFPTELQYFMDDIVVTEIAMQTFESVVLQPSNITSAMHLFTIDPPLPPGLFLDPYLGIIQGDAQQRLEKTVFTVSEHGCGRSVECVLTMAFSLHEHLDLFHGHIEGEDQSVLMRSTNMSPEPPPWQHLQVNGLGNFKFSVLYTSFQILFSSRSLLTLTRGDGVLYATRNNFFLGKELIPDNDTVIVMEFQCSYNIPPCLTLSNSTLTTTVGASFIPIFINVQGEHMNLSVSPDLPLGLSIVPVPPYMFDVYGHGYLVTGECDVAGHWTIEFCVFPNTNSECVPLKINSIPVNMNPFEPHTVMKMEITDNIQDLFEYHYDMYLEEQLVFNRSHMLSSRSIFFIHNELTGYYRLNVCRRKEYGYVFAISYRVPPNQEAIQIQILVDGGTPVFSTYFIGRSVTELYPCRWYTFTMIRVVSSTSSWKYIRSSNNMPYNWRDFDYDDSVWAVGSYQYPIRSSESLYLRQHIEIQKIVDYSVMLLNILIREGVSVYINNVEVIRYHLDFHLQDSHNSYDNHTAGYDYDNATSSLIYPRFVSATISHQYLQLGDNIVAVEIHQYSLTHPQIFFALSASLLASSDYFYSSPFPTVTASTDTMNAYRIFTSDDVEWDAGKAGSILYEHTGYNHQYVNTILLSRSQSCVPTHIELYGVLMYFNRWGLLRTHDFLLLNATDIQWDTRLRIHLQLLPPKTSYHAFRLVAEGEECVKLGQVILYSNNQENCVYNDTMIAIGDALRLPCLEGVGVRIMKCMETPDGVVFANEQRYCKGNQSIGHALVRMAVIVNGIKCDSLYSTVELVKSSLASSLHLNPELLSDYYIYYRVDTEPFCYTEIYLESILWYNTAKRVYRKATVKRKELAEEIAMRLKKDVYVEVSKSVYFVGNLRKLLLWTLVLPATVIAILALTVFGVLARKRKEEKMNALLMS